ncbi:MAG: hypothetical protein S0880_14715 [Actinomycetota bacterium]|nr:hypothetical protein [Actinomycetota bacterium]
MATATTTHHRRRAARTLLVFVAAAAMGACSGDGDGRARPVDAAAARSTVPSTLESTDTTAAASSGPDAAASSSPPATAPGAADERAAAIVLRLEDLPAGWSSQPPDEDEDDEPGGFCDDVDPFDAIEPAAEATSEFTQSDVGPFLTANALVFPDVAGAAATIDAAAEIADACRSYTAITDDGTETDYRIEPLAFPAYGDDTFAMRITATTTFGQLTFDYAYARDDDTVVTVANGGFGEAADSALTESAVRTMTARM